MRGITKKIFFFLSSKVVLPLAITPQTDMTQNVESWFCTAYTNEAQKPPLVKKQQKHLDFRVFRLTFAKALANTATWHPRLTHGDSTVKQQNGCLQPSPTRRNSMQQKQALTLFELNSMVHDVVEATLDRAYWVEAELSEAREVRGHCYMELIQKDLFSATPVARASAKCWRNTWLKLRPKFEHATGEAMHPGMKVMLLVMANFHEAYGFSWIVQDVDPTYTLGDMARKRLEIIKQLKDEGIFHLQKELAIPMFAQRVAVISSENAAGYGDFCDQLTHNDYGFRFTTELFNATMQGEQVEATIISALNDIYGRQDEFDVVVIIRGGGATADMSGFDTLALAENVANFPLPIITGIGHDRDESIIDMVSNTRVKTPTAAATLLVDNLTHAWNLIADCQSRIVAEVGHRMDMEHARLNNLSERIPTLFSLVKEKQGTRLSNLSNLLASLSREKILKENFRISSIGDSLPQLAKGVVEKEANRLRQHSILIKSLDPQNILKRGYSITLLNGKAVRDAADLREGDKIDTLLGTGTIKSVVTQNILKKSPG